MSIFSKVELVDQSKPCTQSYLKKTHKLHKFATTNNNFGTNDTLRHASSHSVHVYQFSAKSD